MSSSEELPLERLRNVGIIAHIDAGKTTLSERLLYFSGVELHMGEVHEGSTVLDWMPEERRRGITITAAAATIPWDRHRIHLIDTPGHVDFTVEVERSLRVLDGAILVLSAVRGVQPQSETVWRQARRHGVPTITFVNQCDRPGADFMATVADLERRFQLRSAVVQYPIGEAEGLSGLVDLIENVAWSFPAGRAPVRGPLPASVEDEAGVLRAELIETLAEYDDVVLEALAEELEPDVRDLRRALRRAALAGELQPVFCGSALRNIGVQRLLDGVVDYLPSPAERGPVPCLEPGALEPLQLEPDPGGPLAALVFKVQRIARREVCFLRVFSGTLEAGSKVLLQRLGSEFEVGELVRVHADAGTPLERARAGEIVAWVDAPGMTGDTFCHPDRPLLLEHPDYSEPVLSQWIEPRSEADRPQLASVLALLAREDPTLRIREDEETGQFLVSGMGELHLEVAARRLSEEFKLETRLGDPSVAYREAVLTTGRGQGRVERRIGERVIHGSLELEVRPEQGSGRCEIEWLAAPPAASGLREAIDQALRRVSEVGPRFGYPLVDARLAILGFETKGEMDAELAFDQAAAIALREALHGASIELLEPLMELWLQVPDAFAGGVLGDLAARGARILGQEMVGGQRMIRARAPLARLHGYSTAVRSVSQGRAMHSIRPAGFQVVPATEFEARGLAWS